MGSHISLGTIANMVSVSQEVAEHVTTSEIADCICQSILFDTSGILLCL